MAKTQKIIVLSAAGLIVIAFLFPPYNVPEHNDKGEVIGWHIEWQFNKQIRYLFRQPVTRDSDGKYLIDIMHPEFTPILTYLEIFGVLVLAGAALLITKKANQK